MPKLMFAIVVVAAALLFGFLGAATLATDLGQSLLIAVAVLLVLMGVVQGSAMIAKSRVAS